MKDKQVLLDLGKVRIVTSDDKNVEVEKLMSVTDPKTKQTNEKWVFQGFYGTIERALEGIVHKDLALAYEQINEIKDYIKQIEELKLEVMKVWEG